MIELDYDMNVKLAEKMYKKESEPLYPPLSAVFDWLFRGDVG